jgi:hypothetical protein
MRARALAGVALVSAVLATSARAIPTGSATNYQVNDPRDVGGNLDLRAARTVPSEGCRTTISTWGPWKSGVVRGGNYAPGKNRLAVLYAFNGDTKTDLTGYLISERGGLILFTSSTTAGNLTPRPAARRGLSRVVVDLCDFLFTDNLDTRPTSIRVAFRSVDGAHRDRMPNHGWLRLHSKLLTG